MDSLMKREKSLEDEPKWLSVTLTLIEYKPDLPGVPEMEQEICPPAVGIAQGPWYSPKGRPEIIMSKLSELFVSVAYMFT